MYLKHSISLNCKYSTYKINSQTIFFFKHISIVNVLNKIIKILSILKKLFKTISILRINLNSPYNTNPSKINEL